MIRQPKTWRTVVNRLRGDNVDRCVGRNIKVCNKEKTCSICWVHWLKNNKNMLI